MKGEKDSLGSLMEQMVLLSLKKLPKIRYFYHHTEASKSSKYVEGALSLNEMDENITVINDSTIDSIFAEKHAQCAFHFPHAKSFDFVIFDKNGDSHAIQVSKQIWQTKCNRVSFFEETQPKYKYILTTQEPDVNLLKGLGSSAFRTALTEHKLRVIHPDFINKDHFKQFCEMK